MSDLRDLAIVAAIGLAVWWFLFRKKAACPCAGAKPIGNVSNPPPSAQGVKPRCGYPCGSGK